MATITIDVPDALRQRMDDAADADWSAIARRAFESHLERMAVRAKADAELDVAVDRLRASRTRHEERRKHAGYDHGYAWAKDRAEFHDLQTVVDAPGYRSAANLVRKTPGFSQRDEFGDAALPSDEMWEGFIDGATALYNDVIDKL
jgi:hypothetical protein